MDAVSWPGFAWLCRVVVFLLVTIASAQEMPVTVATQWSFLQKILSFQRKLEPDDTRKPVFAIVYQSKLRVSLDVRNEIIQLLDEAKPSIGGVAVRVVEIDLSQEPALAQLAASQATVIYVAPLRSYSISTITDMSRALKILTFSSVPSYVEKGLAVGIDNRGGRPHILINRNAALQEGSDFHSQLLKLVTIVD